MLWGTAGIAQMILWRNVEPSPIRRRQWARSFAWFPTLLTAKFILCDVIGFSCLGTPAHVLPVANLQTIAAVLVIAVLVTYRYLHGTGIEAGPESKVHHFAGVAIVGILILLGWTEIGRAFANRVVAGTMSVRDAALARSVAISIFNAVFAVASVTAGFRFRKVELRYLGLGLFGLTLAKIFFVDLAGAAQGYRILSFIALGLLLLGTSVLYGKLSPRLLATNDAAEK
jgi:uncharacterized membrane protein